MLKLKNIVLTKNGRRIVDGISFDFPKAQTTVLIGKSGSGKTSLLRCLAGIEKPDLGEINIGSSDLFAMSPKERCKTVGFVPQFFSLFPHLNVLENCVRALIDIFDQKRSEAEDKAMDILKFLGVDSFMKAFPNELSGGQQQRVAIARALLLDSSYLLFDEPTSAIDPENTAQLILLLQTLQKKGKGLVIATQDMGFAQAVLTQVLFLDQGKIVEQNAKDRIQNFFKTRPLL